MTLGIESCYNTCMNPNRAIYCHPDREHEALGLCKECYFSFNHQLNRDKRLADMKIGYSLSKSDRREHKNLQNREQRLKVKIRVLTYYSPNKILHCSCPRCDVDILDFLTIDHIGGVHYPNEPSDSTKLYRWLRDNNYPSGFQTLCMNCNHGTGKSNRGGVCPHLIR